MRRHLLALLWVILPLGMSAQIPPDSLVVYTPEDVAIFNDYVGQFLPKRDSSMRRLVLETGFYFLGTPYVSYTLEVKEPEHLIVNLRELDCTTFTETVLALARTLKNEDGPSFPVFLCELQKIRYRRGELRDFTSRLHYFSDWLYDNDGLGIVHLETDSLGGEPFPLRVDLMTRVSKNYRQLVHNPEMIPTIDSLQSEISTRRYTYIPKSRVDSANIAEGDIVAMTVSGKGMDIMHMGIAVHNFGRLYFMHASSTRKEVVITEEPFTDYAAKIRSCTGVMVARPCEVPYPVPTGDSLLAEP